MGTQARCIKLPLGTHANFQEITGKLSDEGGVRLRQVKTMEGTFLAYGIPRGKAKNRVPVDSPAQCGSGDGDGEADQGGRGRLAALPW